MGSNPALPPFSHTFDLTAYLSEKRSLINQALGKILVARANERRLIQAMKHSLNAGGKRLRPILCLAAAETVSDSWRVAVPAACALECIHTYSLIHDDLPAMDDDVLRRGKPTCHVAFDEATAILAGDALLTLAFEILCDPAHHRQAGADCWMRVAHTIAAAAGHQGMVEGQMQDMEAEGKRLTLEELKRLHELKTGALIRASVQAGALLGHAETDALERLTRYAEGVGLAFQVTDDVLNVTGDATLMGKAVGTDASHGKNTYPSFMGLDAARAFAQKLIGSALEALDTFDERAEPLRAIARYIVERRR